jgi:hypothetical protein
MSELSDDAKALVNEAREEDGLLPGERARLRARVLATASAGGVSLAGSILSKAAAAKAFGVSVVGWGAVAVAVAGAGSIYGLTHTAAVHSEAPRLPTPVAHVQPVSAVVDAPAASALPPPADPPPALERDDKGRTSKSKSVESKTRATPLPSAEASFAEDARLLRDVRAALAAGEGDRALSLLDTRNANPAAGVFAEEREAARIVTLCGLGRREARAAADQFLAAHAASPLAERVRRACPK